MNKTKTVAFTGTIPELRTWAAALQSMSSAVPTFEAQRDDCQRFKWAMGQNYARVQAAIVGVYDAVNSECADAVAAAGGEPERQKYLNGLNLIVKAFATKGPGGEPIHETDGQGNTRMRIRPAVREKLKARLAQYDKDNAGMVAAQKRCNDLTAGLEQRPATVSLVCVDFKDIADTVNGCYMNFVERIIMGLPRPGVLHRILQNTAAKDPKFKADLVAQITVILGATEMRASPPAACAIAIYNAIYEKPKPE